MYRLFASLLVALLLLPNTGCAWLSDFIIANADRAGGDGRVKLDTSTKENRQKQFKSDFLRDQDHQRRLDDLRRSNTAPIKQEFDADEFLHSSIFGSVFCGSGLNSENGCTECNSVLHDAPENNAVTNY